MIELGKMQTLTAVRRTGNGLYLKDINDSSSATSVLLPNNELDEDSKAGDNFEVFIYKDSQDRIIATTQIPYITLGNFAALTVREVSPIGAFLDWGLKKDLLLPFAEQMIPVSEGDKVFVGLYVDKSERLCATSKVYHLLLCDSPYKVNDTVTGTVYELNDKLGAFVAVDDKYSALLPSSYIIAPLAVGDIINAFVKNVRDDGKLTLSLTEESYKHMDSDASIILSALKENGGFLPFNDKSDASQIRIKFGMSKNSFKRAIGRLYKERKILLQKDGIQIL